MAVPCQAATLGWLGPGHISGFRVHISSIEAGLFFISVFVSLPSCFPSWEGTARPFARIFVNRIAGCSRVDSRNLPSIGRLVRVILASYPGVSRPVVEVGPILPVLRGPVPLSVLRGRAFVTLLSEPPLLVLALASAADCPGLVSGGGDVSCSDLPSMVCIHVTVFAVLSILAVIEFK